MKYIKEFRNASYAKALVELIKKEVNPNKQYRFMEFCGGHTHAIQRYGIPSIIPKNIELIHGPGCPVCVLPIARVDKAIAIASVPNVILCSYGDMIRVPGSDGRSLLKARGEGSDVRIVYSVDDCIKIAQENPNKTVVFFAIGFETTTPPTAVALKIAKSLNLNNFNVYCNHVLTTPSLEALLQSSEEDGVELDGFIGPAHVSVIIGSDVYIDISKRYKKHIVVAGFEPIDVLDSILMLIKQVNSGVPAVENEYTRAVSHNGNIKAQELMKEVFDVRDSFEWRGLGFIPKSGLKINDKYKQFDAEVQLVLPDIKSTEYQGCQCGDVLKGKIKPIECPLFEKTCNPENPVGACMVSSEGACAAYYTYSRGVHA